MSKHNILLIHPTIQPNGVAYFEENANVFYAPDGQEDTLIRCMNEHQIEAVALRCEPITQRIMDAVPTLKVIGMHGVGVDHIDMKGATQRGIRVLNVPDANYLSVAEHTMMFLLSLSRSLGINDRSVRDNAWYSREQRYTMEIYQKKLLIVGFGRIGRTVAKRAQAFEMHVMAYDNFVSKEVMEGLGVEKIQHLEDGLSKADFVTLHVPLTTETHGMMSDAQFRQMKNSAYVINMGRGPVVDEAALVRALESGEIAGAGLDVLEAEPPQADHPLFHMHQVLLTPHIGGDTIEAKRRTSDILSHTVLEALDGMDTYNWLNRPK